MKYIKSKSRVAAAMVALCLSALCAPTAIFATAMPAHALTSPALEPVPDAAILGVSTCILNCEAITGTGGTQGWEWSHTWHVYDEFGINAYDIQFQVVWYTQNGNVIDLHAIGSSSYGHCIGEDPGYYCDNGGAASYTVDPPGPVVKFNAFMQAESSNFGYSFHYAPNVQSQVHGDGTITGTFSEQ